MTDSIKSNLKISQEVGNFEATGLFACSAKCSAACGRIRPAQEIPGCIEDLSVYCNDYIPVELVQENNNSGVISNENEDSRL